VLRKTITIINKLGLHARAAAKLVHLASRYGSEIHLIKNGNAVNGKSIMGVMMLAASKGTELEITAEGEDEAVAIEAVEQLIQNRFGEAE
jgi:phosphocarrier protein